MYSAYKLNKLNENIQTWCTPFPILNRSVVVCLLLTIASCPAYRLQVSQKTSKVVWYFHFFKNFPQFVVIHTAKAFSIVKETEVDFFFNSIAVSIIRQMLVIWSLSICSSVFSKSSFYIWKFLVHLMLKPSLKDFEHFLANMLNECTLAVNILWLCPAWYRNENWPLPVLWPLLTFPNLLAYLVQQFNNIIF